MGFQHLTAKQILVYNKKKPEQLSFWPKSRNTRITKMNDNTNMDSAIAGYRDNTNMDSAIAGYRKWINWLLAKKVESVG